MTTKAIFLDFYGTVVHEDDEIIPLICQKIKESSSENCSIQEIGQYWWASFSKMFQESYGENFDTQRNLGRMSLCKTIEFYQSNCTADEIILEQFEHWQKPGIYEDSLSFLKSCELPVYIISNIDTSDVMAAIKFHGLKVSGVITSEDVRSYKPRSEIFAEALRRYELKNTDVLHVGDSLTSDVVGAQNMGIRAVWINRMNKMKPDHIQPNYIIKKLTELEGIM
ncbi:MULTISPECIES: HAD family hydrolase [Paenibacillus]|uniref:HAD family hydrolase n=1 Tax=Paenibacillus TaxID=44249 RepID=UPI00017884A5|nr:MULTISPECIES: HAD family hydrolase [Paenibacillus]ACX66685.1 HAD-superfamily hydrolase, subfamily IA, variant 1 [Paenibacillus sp. Y412MC10]MCM3259154.1 HAD family hydrolase [Paenibacillus lautus]